MSGTRKPTFRTMTAMTSMEAPDRLQGVPRQVMRLDQLQPLSGQPRQTFAPESMDELTRSIETHGVLTPLIIRANETGTYDIIAGERRYRAAQRAGLHTVPVVIRDIAAHEAHIIAYVENNLREPLNPLDDAEARVQLLSIEWGTSTDETIKALNVMRKDAAAHADLRESGQALFDRLGGGLRLESFSGSRLRLLKLPDHLKAAVSEGLPYNLVLAVAPAPADQHDHLMSLIRKGASLQTVKASIRGKAKAQGNDYAALRQRVTPRRVEALPPDKRAHAKALMAELLQLIGD